MQTQLDLDVQSKVERSVQTIGKRCFRNCYAIACQRGEYLTKRDLVRHDPDLEGTTESGQATRLSAIKKIFREGWQELALQEAEHYRQA